MVSTYSLELKVDWNEEVRKYWEFYIQEGAKVLKMYYANFQENSPGII